MPDVRHLAAVVAFVAIVATAAAGGGYLPTTWGWATLGPAAVAAAALFLRHDFRLPRAAAALLLLLGLFVAWTALSLLWTDSMPRTVNEVERDLVYLATVAAVLALPLRRLTLTLAVLAGSVAVCGAGLVTRLFPDHYGLDAESAYRLGRPIGYWNAMGALAAIGTLLAIGVAADARPRVLRILASAAQVVLVPTLVFTQSRGAVIALLVGIAVALALHPRRGRLVLASAAAGVPALAAAGLAAGSPQLTGESSSLAAAAHQGHRLAFAFVVLVAFASLAPLLVDLVAPRLPRLPRLSHRGSLVLAAVALAAGAAVMLTLAGKAYDAFRAPTRFGQTGLRAHVLSLSGHGRTTYWRVALDEYRANPVLGSGAGTYDIHWTRDRPFGVGARDAHSLYVETLAELGPIGLALLVAALGAPFAALRTSRAGELVPALASAYAAYLVHAAADWAWELPTLTLAALLCAATLSSSDEREVRVRARPLVAALAVGTAVVAVFVQYGNRAAADADAAFADGRPREALADARKAARWAPWAAQPWRVRADAERELGRHAASRRSARKAVSKDPLDWINWYQLAYLTTGREHDDAAVHARELNPLALRLDAG